MSESRITSELSAVSTAQWDEARHSLPIIQRLAQTTRRTRLDIAAAATELGCSRAQLYVLLNRYITDPRLTSLLPRRRGPERGGSRLPPDVDALIDQAIE